MRALSHGCIRTEHILLLAEKLLGEGAPVPAAAPADPAATAAAAAATAWTPERIAQTVASKKTVQANFPKPLPVYIVYMSSAALQDGTIKDYADIYRKDGKVIAALNNAAPAKTRPSPRDKVAAR